MAKPPASSLRLDTVTNGDHAVVLVRGEVDASTAPQLLAVVEAAVEDASELELDMAELGFLDSTGLSVIAAAIRALEKVDGRLVVSHAPQSMVRLLEITDLGRFLELVDPQT